MTYSDDEKELGIYSGQPCSRIQIYHPEPNGVFQATKDHKSWAPSGRSPYVYENLPEFDGLKAHGLSEDEEDKFVWDEIRRYSRYAESDKPDPFDSAGVFDKTDAVGFADLSSLIDQIQCNLQIVLYENASLALEHCPNTELYRSYFRPLRVKILERYGKEPRSITGRCPRRLSDPDKNIRGYHALVDFIFGSMAWWLMRVAQNKKWESQIMAILARWAVKLKIIALNPNHCAQYSLSRGYDTIRRLSIADEDEDEITVPLLDNTSDEPTTIKFSGDVINWAFGYYISKLQLRNVLEEIIVGVTSNMIIPKVGCRSSASFEVRTLIYKGGLRETLRELFVPRDTSVIVSSDPSSIVHSYIALQLAVVNAERIDEASARKPKPQFNEANGTDSDTIVMEWKQENSKGRVETDRLDDLISVLVPLGLRISRSRLRGLAALLHSDMRDGEELMEISNLHRSDSITTEFRLNTKAFLKRKRAVNLPFVDPDVISTSEIPLWKSPKGAAQ